MEDDELIQQEPFQVTVSITMSKTMTVYKENPGHNEYEEGRCTWVSDREPINEADVRLQHTLPDEKFPDWHVDELEVIED
jgi:hypothetical protein